MSNFLAKAVKKVNILSMFVAAILVIGIAVGALCGLKGWGVFHQDVLLEDSKTLTVSVEQYVFETSLDKIEETCENALKDVNISYELKGQMSGSTCELVYLFNSDVDLTNAKAALETALTALEQTEEFEGFTFLVGANSEVAVGTLAEGYVLRGAIAGVVLAVLVFAYAAIRLGLYKGIAAGVSTLLGMLLTTALVIATRVPVTASVIYVLATSGLLSAVLSMVALNKVQETEKTAGMTAEEVIVSSLATKEILTFSALAGAALVVFGAVATAGVRWFAVLALIALVVATFMGLLYAPAFYLPFKEKVDAKPVEGAYVGAEKTSTKVKKVFAKKEEKKAVQPAPVEEVVEEPAEEAVEEVAEEATEETPVEEVVEETTEETPVEEVVEEATEETEEKQD